MSGTSSLGYSDCAATSAAKEKAGAESESKAAELTISQMSRHFGVSLRTLRFYEDRGLIAPRRKGATRFYQPSDKSRMEMILKAKTHGFTLVEIAGLVGCAPDLENRRRHVSPNGRLERAAA